MTSTSNKVCCPDGQESLIAVHEIHTQKSILNQNRVHQSLYLQNIASLNNTINNTKTKQKKQKQKRRGGGPQYNLLGAWCREGPAFVEERALCLI